MNNIRLDVSLCLFETVKFLACLITEGFAYKTVFRLREHAISTCQDRKPSRLKIVQLVFTTLVVRKKDNDKAFNSNIEID